MDLASGSSYPLVIGAVYPDGFSGKGTAFLVSHEEMKRMSAATKLQYLVAGDKFFMYTNTFMIMAK